MEVRQEVTIELVGLLSGQSRKNTFQTRVSSALENAVDDVKSFIDSKNTKMNYTLYYNGKFITRSLASEMDLKVKNGDMFKVIPIMGGG